MRKIYSLIALFWFFSSTTLAQIIAISGKVSDSKTGLPVAGATLKIGSTGTSTDKGGGFNLVLEKSVIEQHGITVTCIGYQKTSVAYKADHIYNLTLMPAVNTLSGVTISNGESIIQKAIRKIPLNYPVKDVMLEGFLRMYHIVKDSVAYRQYYKNDAVIKMRYTPYTTKEEPQVVLLQNNATHLTDLSLAKDTLRWVNSYLVPHRTDMVHTRTFILAANSAKKYTYVINGKDWVNGSRVYVVNFFSMKQNDQAGTLYIDTASYAIVKTELTLYNVKSLSGLGFKKSYTVNYKKINGRWYLDHVKANAAANHNGFDQSASVDYKTTAIDSTRIEDPAYHEVIQNRSMDVNVNNPGTAETQAKYAGLFKSSTADPLMTQIPTPAVDTTKRAPTTGTNTMRGIYNYLRNGNLHRTLTINGSPFSLAENQPLIGNSVGDIANYSLGNSLQFRLKKEVFFSVSFSSNFGIGSIWNTELATSFLYNFQFNNAHRPISVSPSLGYSYISLSKAGTSYYNQHSLIPGIGIAIEHSHNLSYFIQAKYYGILNSHNQGILLTRQLLAPTIGLIFK
ncbi:hypothetical protein KXQ82_10780 [Mucilaginibacter sp. HMF5004]|uniref:carboxypeptidase-like regulatory domain-containing protein n=1 Tax=Mucilaginibacter rivuli TaxID=2857527 RepID=UPI001C5E6B2B|nr:carboxypeptidase-like regulatory domain-containing protein [Mucilaginibacter rivuli]MBW4890205.1 hypothetical protein [Mucilaginibacter rivuli]